jgi:AcrR family transcriptional regulator
MTGMTSEVAAKVDGRRERSRRTRQRIVLAAYDAFCETGLDVPLTAIAERAGVSVQSVYVAFGTKFELLRAALQYAVHGDDQPQPPHERPWFAEMAAEPDPRRAIGILLGGTQGIYDRVSPFARVFRTSAPDVAGLWTHSEDLRWGGMNLMTQVLLAKGGVHPGLTEEHATDIVFVLLGPESYQSFADRGWSSDRWQGWVTETLMHALFVTT